MKGHLGFMFEVKGELELIQVDFYSLPVFFVHFSARADIEKKYMKLDVYQ
jgi:hypothetical protein